MIPINKLVRRVITLRENYGIQMTLLGICPTSEAVMAASVKTASRCNTPILFPATLNQVDRDGGYTGWTPVDFVDKLDFYRRKYNCQSPLYACLDHGGPWLKDRHTLENLSINETMSELKLSITAFVEAGYRLLHIDPTVDRTLYAGTSLPIELVVERTVELIVHAENERNKRGLSPIDYEVGTEEVHGGLVNEKIFKVFIDSLKNELQRHGLRDVWPCFIVGRVGTDMHTTYFDPKSALDLYEFVKPYGSLIKGHYTDWVSNLDDYPTSGIGAANFGADLTQQEYLALKDLSIFEQDMLRGKPSRKESRILESIETAVYESNRWKKWLLNGEEKVPFQNLEPNRKTWLIHSGARYIWTDSRVVEARQSLYENLSTVLNNPNEYVIDRIARRIDDFILSFHLFNSFNLLEKDIL